MVEGFLPATGSVLPGGYVSKRFQPPIRFRVDTGWEFVRDEPDRIDLSRADHPEQLLSIMRIQRVYASRSHAVFEDALSSIEPVPPVLSQWIRNLPSTTASEVTTVLYSGQMAQQIDIGASGYEFEGCPKRCVLMFQLDWPSKESSQLGTGAFWIENGEKARIRVLDVGASKIVVVSSSPEESFQEFQDVVDGTFTPISFSSANRIATVSVDLASERSRSNRPVDLVANLSGPCEAVGIVTFYEGEIRVDRVLGQGRILDGVAQPVSPITFPTSGQRRVVARYDGSDQCDSTVSVPLTMTLDP